MATGYTFYYGSGNFTGTFVGTSATAPLLAGMMARLNQMSGKRIGFVNADWYAVRTTAFALLSSFLKETRNPDPAFATGGRETVIAPDVALQG